MVSSHKFFSKKFSQHNSGRISNTILNIDDIRDLFISWTDGDYEPLESVAVEAFNLRPSRNRRRYSDLPTQNEIEGLRQYKDLTYIKLLRSPSILQDITIYRGISGKQAENLNIKGKRSGSTVREIFYNLSSWTEDIKKAEYFASLNEPFGFVLKTTPRISDILSYWDIKRDVLSKTFSNNYMAHIMMKMDTKEKEVILLGHSIDSKIIKKVKFDPMAWDQMVWN